MIDASMDPTSTTIRAAAVEIGDWETVAICDRAEYGIIPYHVWNRLTAEAQTRMGSKSQTQASRDLAEIAAAESPPLRGVVSGEIAARPPSVDPGASTDRLVMRVGSPAPSKPGQTNVAPDLEIEVDVSDLDPPLSVGRVRTSEMDEVALAALVRSSKGD